MFRLFRSTIFENLCVRTRIGTFRLSRPEINSFRLSRPTILKVCLFDPGYIFFDFFHQIGYFYIVLDEQKKLSKIYLIHLRFVSSGVTIFSLCLTYVLTALDLCFDCARPMLCQTCLCFGVSDAKLHVLDFQSRKINRAPRPGKVSQNN